MEVGKEKVLRCRFFRLFTLSVVNDHTHNWIRGRELGYCKMFLFLALLVCSLGQWPLTSFQRKYKVLLAVSVAVLLLLLIGHFPMALVARGSIDVATSELCNCLIQLTDVITWNT